MYDILFNGFGSVVLSLHPEWKTADKSIFGIKKLKIRIYVLFHHLDKLKWNGMSHSYERNIFCRRVNNLKCTGSFECKKKKLRGWVS